MQPGCYLRSRTIEILNAATPGVAITSCRALVTRVRDANHVGTGSFWVAFVEFPARPDSYGLSDGWIGWNLSTSDVMAITLETPARSPARIRRMETELVLHHQIVQGSMTRKHAQRPFA
jgi:hypothetical protein